MSLMKDLLTSFAKSGPENIKKMLEIGEKLPSDSTLLQLIAAFDRMYPYLPMIQKAMNNGGMEGLKTVADKIPDKETLEKLMKFAPYLEKLPDTETLKQLLAKADTLESLIKKIDEE